ncbi:enoyl-CoA hydratase-related protein [Siccirubricoccus deserti]
MEGPVQLSRRGRLLVLRLHRPEAHNAIDSAMLLAIDAALDLAEADPAIRTVLLEGNAEVFCTGLDLKAALGGGDGPMDPAAAERGARQYLAVLRRFTRSPRSLPAGSPGAARRAG